MGKNKKPLPPLNDERTLDEVIDQLCEHGKVGNINSRWLLRVIRELEDWAAEEGVRLKVDYGDNLYQKSRIYLRKVKND